VTSGGGPPAGNRSWTSWLALDASCRDGPGAPAGFRRRTELRAVLQLGDDQSGFRPAATLWTLSNALRNAFAQFSHVGPAVCG